jgi:hypothetical protein
LDACFEDTPDKILQFLGIDRSTARRFDDEYSRLKSMALFSSSSK